MFRNVRIFATDLNAQFGAVIERGVYPEEQVKRIPEDILRKHFLPADDPGHFVVAEPIRKSVRFQHHNLTSLSPIRSGFGLVLCKNVLLHLSNEERVNVIRMFRDALSEGGFLAMERTQKLPGEAQEWFRQVTSGAQIFQKN